MNGLAPPGIPGGGENAGHWRHHEIAAAFEGLDVTAAVAQADKFELIARYFEDGLLAFEHSVRTASESAWSGVGARAAAQAITTYARQAYELVTALHELPAVVRAAAEAIVSTKYAIPAVVSTTEEQPWSVGRPETHRAAASVQDEARAAMHHRYVVPFGELFGRIPVLPMPSSSSGLPEPDGAGSDERLVARAVGSQGSSSTGLNESSTGTVAEQVGTALTPGGTTDAGADSNRVRSQLAEPDVPGDPLATSGTSSPGSGSADRLSTAPDSTGTASSAAAASGSAGAVSTVSDRSASGSAAVRGEPGAVAAGSGNSGAVRSGAGGWSAGAGSAGSWSPGAGPASFGGGGGSPVTSVPVPAAEGRPAYPGYGARVVPGGADSVGIASGLEARPGPGARVDVPGALGPVRPGGGASVTGSAIGGVIGGDGSPGTAPGRAGDRHFHCPVGPGTTVAPGTDDEHRIPEYLVTQANTDVLLGTPRPAIAGGVIGGDAVRDGQQGPTARDRQ
ncbi:hypothetical protein [Nocardia sp. SSK8]|uniref:hypothetical protein n=1 Tax=Nocardia sp. SSK8 TaxID=3120154 RepID=UPI003008FA78